jgi:hypothetical protein
MKRMDVLFWSVMGGVVGLSFYAFFNAMYFLWSATGPLVHTELRQDYFLKTALWFSGFLHSAIASTFA